MLEKDVLEVFDKANNPDAIKYNLNDLNIDFKYLFQTPSFPVHSVGWGRTNNLSVNINRGQQ